MKRRAAVGVLVAAAVLAACSSSPTVAGLRLPTFTSHCYRRPPIAEPAFATVPIKIARPHSDDALVTVAVCVGSRGPFTFLVDSGLPTSVIDTSLANSLPGEQGFDNSSRCGAIDGLRYTTGVMIGPRKIEAGEVAVGNLRSFAGNLSGIIGADILSRLGVVRVDYRRRTMTVGLEAAPVPPSRSGSTSPLSVPKRFRAGTVTAVPMQVGVRNLDGGLPAGLDAIDPVFVVTASVPVSLGGAPHRFAVGTGTEITALNPATAASLPGLSKVAGPYKTTGALDCDGQATAYQLPDWRIGTIQIGATKVGVPKSPISVGGVDGVLGSATLQELSPVVIDYSDGVLLLGPQAAG